MMNKTLVDSIPSSDANWTKMFLHPTSESPMEGPLYLSPLRPSLLQCRSFTFFWKTIFQWYWLGLEAVANLWVSVRWFHIYLLDGLSNIYFLEVYLSYILTKSCHVLLVLYSQTLYVSHYKKWYKILGYFQTRQTTHTKWVYYANSPATRTTS